MVLELITIIFVVLALLIGYLIGHYIAILKRDKHWEGQIDFNVSPPFELNSKKTPSYSTYLWAVTLVVGFIAGMAVRRSGKKDEGKTETK
jgi:H+/Cl- antiporter ClcA